MAAMCSGTALLMLLLLAAPWLFAEYWLAQLTFVLIYGIAGLGLMLLAGFTGQFSIGHAAFLGVGAYTQAVLTNMGWPFPLALVCAAGLSAAVGVVVGLPALRVKGIYLGIATLSFGFIVEEVLARWESRHRRQRGHARQGARACSAGRWTRATALLLSVPGRRRRAPRWPS